MMIPDGNQLSGLGWRGGSATVDGGSPALYCKTSPPIILTTHLHKQICAALDVINAGTAFVQFSQNLLGNLGTYKYIHLFSFRSFLPNGLLRVAAAGGSIVKDKGTPQDHRHILIRKF